MIAGPFPANLPVVAPSTLSLRRIGILSAVAGMLITGAAAHAAAPSPITTLGVAAVVSTGLGASSMSVTLTWTAPEDQDLTGGFFSVRYSSFAPIPDDAAYLSANYSLDIPTNAARSARQTYTLDFLDTAATHYFAVKSTNSVGETSGLSVCATAQSAILVPAAMGGDSVGIAWGDYDGDGRQDLAVVEYAGGQAYLLHNEGGGGFTQVIRGAGAQTYGAAWADYDRDGDLDLAVGERGGGARDAHLLRNDGGGAFTQVDLPGDGGGSGVAWGDFDNDGDLDLAAANVTGNLDAAILWNAGGVFTAGPISNLRNSQGVAAGDYDNDGDLDLVFGLGTNAALLTNVGNSTFTAGALAGSGSAVRTAAWADYDGDGDLDLAVATAGDEYLLRNDGGSFALVALAGSGGDSEGIAWADYDSDGDFDLAVSNHGGEGTVLLRNDGFPSFTKIVVPGSAGTSQGVSWGDLDGDGDLDLAVANDSGMDAYVVRNDSPAAHAVPGAPSTLSAAFAEYFPFASSGTLTLSWTGGSDATTPAAALEYLVRVGTTTPGSSTTWTVPPRFSLDGYSGGGSDLYSTRLGAGQRGLKLAMQKETTAYWAVTTEDGDQLRSSESSEGTAWLAAPAAVANLVSAPSYEVASSSWAWVKLHFTAPGENGPAGNLQSGAVYDIRWSTAGALNSQAKYLAASGSALLSAAGDAAGAAAARTVAVEAGRPYYFALTTKDAFGVRSALSNATTGLWAPALLEVTTQTAHVSALQGDIVPLAHVRLWAESANLVWTGLRVRKEGTLPDEGVSRVAVYEDLNLDGELSGAEKLATRSQLAVFSSSAAALTINPQTLTQNTTRAFFIGVELAPAYLPVEAATVSLRLDGEAFTVLGGGVRAIDFPGLHFDGLNDRLTAAVDPNMNVTALTLEAWLRTTDAGADRAVITRGNSTGGTGYRLWLGAGGCAAGVPTFFIGNVALCASRDGSPVTVNDGRWHHVAAVQDATVGRMLFVDGAPLTGAGFSGGIGDAVSDLAVGGPNTADASGQYLDGELDEVRVSNFVRYSTSTAFVPARRNSSDGSTVAHYHFDLSGESAIVPDAGGVTANHGSMQGEPQGYGRSTNTVVNDVADVLYASGTDITPSFMFRNQTLVPLLKLQLWTTRDFATVNQVSVAHAGTGAESGVADLKMYADDGDGVFDAAVDSLLQTVANFAVGKATFTLAAQGKAQTVSASTKTFFFSWDVGDSAQLTADLGLQLAATQDFLLAGSTDSMDTGTFPLKSATRTVVGAEARVTAETVAGTWVNVSSIVFVGNFGSQNVDHFHAAWDNAPATDMTEAAPSWTSANKKATYTATADGSDWYFHARAFDPQPGGAGTQQDFGPFWVDRTPPQGSGFVSYDSTGGALGESQFNDLASGVTAQVTVRDATSGLSLDGPAPAAPVSGTVSLYRFDEASGASWGDAASGLNVLTPVSATPTRAAGRFGTGLQFTGSEDLRKTSPERLPLGASARTVEAWIRPASTAGALGILGWGNSEPMRFFLSDGRLTVTMGGATQSLGPVLSTGAWQHVAFTYDGSAGRFFLDGSDLGSAAFGVQATDAGILYVGRNDNGQLFKGVIDEARILDRELSADEVAADRGRGDPYFVSYSTDAGRTWRVVASTRSADVRYVSRTGAHGAAASDQTLRVEALDLVTSTSTLTGNRATNQLRFHAADLAGNVLTAGPFGVLADTNTPVSVSTPMLPGNGSFAGNRPDLYWMGPSTPMVQGMGGRFFVQVSSGDPAFGAANVRISISTPATVADIAVPWVTGVYLSSFTLAESTTYYWRVRSQSALGLFGPWGPTGTFVTDITSPAASGFQVFNSTGGVALEPNYVDLRTGVTAQVTLQDVTAGLSRPAAAPLGPRPVAYWTFNETEGLSSLDASGNGNTGTLTCTGGGCEPARYGLTAFGAGLRCNGGQGLTAAKAQFDFPAGSDFTIEAWLNPDRVDNERVIAALGDIFVGAGTNYAFRIKDGKLYMTNASLGGFLTPTALVSAGVWQHLAAVIRGTNVSFYVNGVLKANGAWPGNSGGASMDFSLGTAINNLGVWSGSYVGLMDEVRVSSTALDAGQVADSYQQTAPGRFGVEVSTSAGYSWQVVSATAAVGGAPYLELSGAPGDTTANVLSIRNLSLAHSTSTLTGNRGTNQLRVMSVDRKGNYTLSGPYAVIVDTVAAASVSTPTLPMDGVYVSTTPNFAWRGPSTASLVGMGANPVFLLEVAANRAFAGPVISVSTPAAAAAADAFYTQGGYVPVIELADATTYFWRVRARSALGNYSPDLTVASFVTDFGSPTASGYVVFNSTDGAMPESLNIDLAAPVTAQALAADAGPAGLAVSAVAEAPPYGVVYTTAGVSMPPTYNAEWFEGSWGQAFVDPVPDPAAAVASLAVYQGKLYAGTSPLAKVFQYDGSAWTQSALLTGTTVSALAEFQGQLYAGLWDSDILYRYNGTSWTPAHDFGAPIRINALKEYNGQLYAATSDSGRVWAYDPVSGNWYVAFDSPSTELYSLEVFNGRLFAGGYPDIYMFDGSIWAVSLSKNATIFALKSFNGALYAGTDESGRVFRFDRTWNTSAVFDAPEDEIYRFGVHGGRLYAGVGPSNTARLYMFDGRDWLRGRSWGNANDRVSALQPYGGRLYFGMHADPDQAVVLVSTPIAAVLSGTDGDLGPQTLKVQGLQLRNSINGNLCGGSSACSATNQVRFQVSDRAGGVLSAGPYAILVDPLLSQPTVQYPGLGQFVREGQPTFSWLEASTQPTHLVQVSNQADFSALIVNQQTGNFTLTSPSSLPDAATYYWRVQARNSLGLWTGFSLPVSFAMDITAPSTAAYAHFNSTGGTLSEPMFGNLIAGVTAQFEFQDLNSGLSLVPASLLNRLGTWHFEEGSGGLALDASGNGRHGSLRGSPTRPSAVAGAGIGVGAGAGDSVDVGTIAALGYPGLTTAIWVRPGVLTVSSATVWASEQARLWYKADAGKVLYQVETDPAKNGGCALATAQTFNAETWTHLAFEMAFAAGENRLYVDGRLAASCAGAGTPGDTPYRFGNDGHIALGTAQPLNGRIDEARIFGAALTPAELQAELREPHYYLFYSTTAGSQWNAVSSTAPGSGAYLSVSGTPNDAVIQARNLTLTESTNSAVCAQAAACGATNQLRFIAADRAGNVRSAGLFSVLVDTSVPLPEVTSLTPLTTDSLYVTAWATDTLTGIQDYLFEASTSSLFDPPVTASPFVPQSTYTFTGLLSASTYYVRVIARDSVLNVSTPAVFAATATFATVDYSTFAVLPVSALQDGLVPMLGFTLKRSAADAYAAPYLDGVWVKRTGTAADGDVDKVRVYGDNGDAAFSALSDTLLAEASLDSGQARVDLAAVAKSQLLDVVVSTFFVVYRMDPAASVGLSIGLEISSATDIVLRHPGHAFGVFPTTTSLIPITDGANNLLLTPASLAPAGGAQPGANNIPMIELRGQTNTGTSVISSMVVTMSGTLAPNKITGLSVWRDADPMDGVFDPAGDERLSSGFSPFSNGVSTVVFTAQTSSRTWTVVERRLYLAVDLAADAEQNMGFQLQVATESHVTLENWADTVVMPFKPIQSSTLNVILQNTITVSPLSELPAAFVQGEEYAVLKTTLTVDAGTAQFRQLKVSRTGAGSDADVEFVGFWRDQNPDGAPFNRTLDVSLGSAAFSGGAATLRFSTQTLIVGTTYVYFVTYKIHPGANPGNELGAKVTSGNDLTVADANTGVAGPFPIQTSTRAITATVNKLLIPEWGDEAGGALVQGSDHAALLRLKVVSSKNEFDWLGLTVKSTGTAADSDVAAVNVFRDYDGDCAFDVGIDSRVTSGVDVFVSGTVSMALNQTISTMARCYFITASIADGAVPGRSVGVLVTTTSAFNLFAPNVVSSETVSWPLKGGPVDITQFANTVTVTTASIVPALGAEPGAQYVGLMSLVLQTDVSDAEWLSLRVDQTGSAADADVASVKLYYDINGAGSWDSSNLAQYQLVTSTTNRFGDNGASSVLLTFSTNPVLSPAPNEKRFFLVVDLSTSAAPGKAIVARANTSGFFTVKSPNTLNTNTSFVSGALAINPPPETMYVVWGDSAPATVTQGDANVPMLTLRAWMSGHSGAWSELKVTRSGAGADADVPFVKLYRDEDGDGLLTVAVDRRLSTATFVGGAAQLRFSTQTVTASTQTYFLTYDIKTTAGTGDTVGARIPAAGDFKIETPNTVSTLNFPLQSLNSAIQATRTGLFVVGTNQAPGELTQAATDQVMLSLSLQTTQYALTWNAITVRSSGTATDSDIAAVNVWEDVNKNGTVDAGTDTKITSGLNTFLGGVAVVSLNPVQEIGTQQERFLLTVDVAPFAEPGRTLAVVLESTAAFSLVSPNFGVNQGYPILSDVNTSMKKLAERLLVLPTDLAVNGINQGAQAALVKLEARASRNKTLWTQLRVQQAGTLGTNEITTVGIYRDLDGSGSFTDPDLLVGSAAFSGSQASIAFSSAQTVAVATQTYFITVEPKVDATVGADVRLLLQQTDFTIATPDAAPEANLPFNTSAPKILDARTPSQPVVSLAEGYFSSNFEYLPFSWASSVGTGTITGALYAVGTAPGATDILGWTAVAADQTAVRASGFPLLNGATYFVTMRVQASTGPASPVFESPLGVSTHGVLMDFQKPLPPALTVTSGDNAVLLTWTTLPGGVSGIKGYLIEYQLGSSPLWYNARTKVRSDPAAFAAAPAGARGESFLRAAALTADDLVQGNSYQATGLPAGTLTLRIRSVSGAGVLSPEGVVSRIQLGALPGSGISDASAYPNPFDSRQRSVNIHYVLNASADVSIKIFSVFGRSIKQLSFPPGGAGGSPGSNTVQWDGTDASGQKVSKGIYLAVIEANGSKSVLKIGVIH